MRSTRKLLAALVLAALTAALSTALLIPSALGWAAGNTCDATYWICVSKDDGNGVPRAVTGSNDSSYVGDVYFNTTDGINNSVSSVKNRSLTLDFYFWDNVSYGGNHYCLDADWYNANLGSFGLWPDDHFSSHQSVSDSC
jgi:hypothetical protein